MTRLLPSLRKSERRRWSTPRQREWQRDTAVMRAMYRPMPIAEALTFELLQHGLVCLGDGVNIDRLARLPENQIREIVAVLLKENWPKRDVGEVLASWRNARETA